MLTAAQIRDKSLVNLGRLKLVEDLLEEFNYILLDCPAGIEQGFRTPLLMKIGHWQLTTSEVSSIRDTDYIIGLLEAAQFKLIDLIVNRMWMDCPGIWEIDSSSIDKLRGMKNVFKL